MKGRKVMKEGKKGVRRSRKNGRRQRWKEEGKTVNGREKAGINERRKKEKRGNNGSGGGRKGREEGYAKEREKGK